MPNGITRRDFLKSTGAGLGALALSRSLLGSPAFASQAAAPLQLARVRPTSAAQALALLGFDDTHRRFADGSIEILLWPGDRGRLDALGMPYRVTETDLVARDAGMRAAADASPAAATQGPPGAEESIDYRRLADYESELQALPGTYPGLARTFELPEKTLEGRTVYGIEVGTNVDATDGRPIFYIDGVHHAREWPAAEYPMSFAHYLLQGYGTDERITALLHSARVAIVPIVNVDGFHFSRESALQVDLLGAVAGGQGGYVRKNRRGWLPEQTAGNPTAYGTDPNRNYPFLWGATTDGLGANEVPVLASTSPNPYDQTYYGAAPLSEPETRNVASYILGHNVIGVVTNHTVGPLVLRPWGHTSEPAYDEEILKAIGDEMSTVMFNSPDFSKIGLGLYPTTGTTDDWAYAAVAALGYTVEHRGNGAFHPPYTQAQSPGNANNWNRVMAAYLLAAEAFTAPENHSVIRGRAVNGAGSPVQATLNLHKEFDTAMWPEGSDGIGPLIHQGNDVTHEVVDINGATGSDGVFEWHVNPSTRPLEASANKTEGYTLKITAGSTKEIEVVVRRGEVLDLGDLTL